MNEQLWEYATLQTILAIAVILFGGLLAMLWWRSRRRQRDQVKALHKADRLYATLSELNKAVVRATDRSKLVQKICDISIEKGRLRMAWIGLIDPVDRHVEPVASREMASDTLPRLIPFLEDETARRGPSAKAVREGIPIVINDLEHDREFRPWSADARARGVRSSATLPIRSNNQVVGILGVCSSETGFFDESELGVLNETVENLAFSLESIEQREALEKMELSVRDSAEKYRALYDNAPLSYQSLDELGDIREVNPAWLTTLGYEQEEVIGKGFGSFLHPDWKAHFEKNFSDFKRAGYVKDVQFKMRHKKGHYLDVTFEGCIGHKPDGSFMQTYCVFKDITEQKRIEAKVHNQELVFASVFQAMPDLFFLMDQDGTIRDYRAQQSDDLYVEPEVFLGKRMQDVLPGSAGQLFARYLSTELRIGELQTFEYVLDLPDARKVFEARISRIPDSTQVVAIVRDISERKAAENTLTAQLTELRRWHDATLDREGRVLELKQEVNALLGELGRSQKYADTGKEMESGD